ncbi:MAG: hemerythrin family protein [Rhodospirillales bacterium]|jgi:hemerythrin|nr:hemerythrin family protein [Rhodospirillales bacterium]|tara:strand:+ start:102 stop:701 length:600 start_codon:yes stop_codon:yes gene_type:complete
MSKMLLAIIVIIVFMVLGIMIRVSLKKKDTERSRAASEANKRKEKRAALSKSVKKIQWEDRFVVDEGVIDRDHKFLFNLINAFNENLSKYHSADQMAPILESLTKYTQTHFRREEKLQQISGFSFHEYHKKEHIALIEKFNSMVRKAEKANEDNVTDVAIEIGSFLQEWLIEHVIDNDLLMKPYVDRMREHAAGMDNLS